MQLLKRILQAIAKFVKATWFLPESILVAIKQKRRQTRVDESEVERLDRIRNPAKYLGKVNVKD